MYLVRPVAASHLNTEAVPISSGARLRYEAQPSEVDLGTWLGPLEGFYWAKGIKE